MLLLTQWLGVTLAITLSLGTPLAADAAGPAASGSFAKAKAGWLDIVQDRSEPLDFRLELAVTHPDFESFLESIDRERNASVPVPVPVAPSNDPVWSELDAGARLMIDVLNGVLSDAGRAEVEQLGEIRLQSYKSGIKGVDLAESLTDPNIPDILADEMSVFLGGLAAGMAAAALAKKDPVLALELAEEFHSRMKTSPARMVIIGFLVAGQPQFLRDGWQEHVRAEDMLLIQRDKTLSRNYVSDLRCIAELSPSA